MPAAGTQVARDPNTRIVELSLGEFIDLLVTQQITPLRAEVAEIKKDVAVMKVSMENKKGADWREYARTVYVTLGSTGAFVLFLIELSKWMRGQH